MLVQRGADELLSLASPLCTTYVMEPEGVGLERYGRTDDGSFLVSPPDTQLMALVLPDTHEVRSVEIRQLHHVLSAKDEIRLCGVWVVGPRVHVVLYHRHQIQVSLDYDGRRIKQTIIRR